MFRFGRSLQSASLLRNKLEKRLLCDSRMVGRNPNSDDILPCKPNRSQRLVSPTIAKDDVGHTSIDKHLDDTIVPIVGKDS